MNAFNLYSMDQLIVQFEAKRISSAVLKAKIKKNRSTSDDDVKANLIEWEAELDLTEADIIAIQQAMEKLDTSQKEALQNSLFQTQNSSQPAGYNAQVMQMGNYIATNVNIFDPNGGHVITFLSQLKLAHSLYCEDTRFGDSLEEDLFRCAKGRLSSIVLEQLNSENKASFANFEAFEKAMTEKYADLSTSFQLLQTCMDLEMKPAEGVSAFATRVSREMSHVAKAISAKFSATKSREMSAGDAFDMMAGLRLLDMVRQFHPEVHRHMSGVSLDKMFSVTEVANEASRLIQHYKGTATEEFSGFAKRSGWREKCPDGADCSNMLKCKLYHSYNQRQAFKRKQQNSENEAEALLAGTFELPHHMRSMAQPASNNQ